MTVALELESDFQELNESQKNVVIHDGGPMMVIAGPGSGKTRCLILRAMNLLLLEKAKPQELVLCTYTRKAAFEMQDRLSSIAQRVGYLGDISLIRVGTIHSICERMITENLHRLPTLDYHTPPLGNEYRTLDDLSQRLFIFEHLEKICGNYKAFFMNFWATRWNVVKQFQKYFDKFTEELIDVKQFSSQSDRLLANLANAYRAYQNLLAINNCVDFAFLQKIAYDLLTNVEMLSFITKGIRYVLVDEYQDTNYIQEQILIKMSSQANNIFVVGDEDQSLYRFRGATVQNIRNFLDLFPRAERLQLTINYRSHPKIIEAYNRWMASIEWKGYRSSNKKIRPCAEKVFSEYPALFSILGQDIYDEAQQFADLVFFLKETGRITDYNQVALLMHSINVSKSNAWIYIQALQEKGINVFCPRAGAYFGQEEVRLMVGCLGRIFSYAGGLSGDTVGHTQIYQYLNECYKLLAEACNVYSTLESALGEHAAEIAQPTEGPKVNRCLADYFYSLLATEPFTMFLKDENKTQNLVIFSQLLDAFQNHFGHGDMGYEEKENLVSSLFNRFLCLLYEDGMNQFENHEQPFPSGCVLVMTIHQAKGLEFPVVVVGSLDRRVSDLEDIDNRLRCYYHSPKNEPIDCISLFDFMRKYYVAFSRAINLLVLTGNERKRISTHLNSMVEGLPRWPNVQSSLLGLEAFKPREWLVPKPRYSYTGHIRVYEVCPRQYQFYREYQFVPSRPLDTFQGLVIHQTIEKIHRIVLDGQLLTLTRESIRYLFEQTYSFLSVAHKFVLNEQEKEKAFKQVEDYFYNNQFEMHNVTSAEEQVAIMKDEYILTGKIDAIMDYRGRREIWDLKTARRPEPDSVHLENYKRQLYIYAHALEQRDKIRPERLILYWTEEPVKEDALMIFPYQPENIEAAVAQFEAVVDSIKARNFDVTVPPHPDVCKKCDMRSLCIREGVIEAS
jgi:ATP-dependent DNA helicase UvrD/PcrA